MMLVWSRLLGILDSREPAALVTVLAALGSSPREAGARMLVRRSGFHGTIGGGALEFRVLRLAEEALDDTPSGPPMLIDQALGPDLGQCCGGRVRILIERFGPADREHVAGLASAERIGGFVTLGTLGDGPRIEREISRSPIREAAVLVFDPATNGLREVWQGSSTQLILFGAGHVGRALALALAPLPFEVSWVDPRAEAFPTHIPGNASIIVDEDPPARLASCKAGTLVAVMTHSHALDLAIVARALPEQRFPYVGVIGSATKRARFMRQLKDAGIDPARLICPIGFPAIHGKEPAVIAASVAAQLLAVRSELAVSAPAEESADAA
jgi:xanthine dehydrogenase accessory factor